MKSADGILRRSVANSTGIDFARQLAERNASLNPATTRKFRSTPVPKGTKLGPGYQDRTQFRTSIEDDEKARRIKALEDMVKLGRMGKNTFEAIRDEIVGGDVNNSHLVKGLDWKLLERVKRGEDVLAKSSVSPKADPVSENPGQLQRARTDVEIEDEFDKIEGAEIQPVSKSKMIKKGEMASPAAVAGKKRNRDDILKELKASRIASAKQPSLGPRFTKLGDTKRKPRIEKDEKGRDVLITIDDEGKVKRKIRKTASQPEPTNDHGLLVPDKHVKPLGMEIPTVVHLTPDVADDGDIFEGVGTEYKPLGDLEDVSGDSDTSVGSGEELPEKPLSSPPQIGDDSNFKPESIPAREFPDSLPHSLPPQPDKPQTNQPPRNYFNEPSSPSASTHAVTSNTLDTPTLLAALKKASAIPLSAAASEPEVAAKLERRRKMLDSHDRDADDMDMGFGESRFEDGEDGDERKVKLSVWGQEERDEEESGKGKRKRGGKKRKGDGKNAADVLRVIEQRKAEGGSRPGVGV